LKKRDASVLIPLHTGGSLSGTNKDDNEKGTMRVSPQPIVKYVGWDGHLSTPVRIGTPHITCIQVNFDLILWPTHTHIYIYIYV